MMSFTFLAPDIVEAIVDGKQPVELTAERLKRSASLPLLWLASDACWGFLSKNPELLITNTSDGLVAELGEWRQTANVP